MFSSIGEENNDLFLTVQSDFEGCSENKPDPDNTEKN